MNNSLPLSQGQHRQRMDIYRQHKLAHSREQVRNDSEIVVEEEMDARDGEGRQRRIRIFFRMCTVLGIILILGAGAGIAVKGLLEQAAQLRTRLNVLHQAVGLERACGVEFLADQPNAIKVAARIDPALVRSVAVTYDNGETWRTLYARKAGEPPMEAGPGEGLRIEDRQAFLAPPSGKRSVQACVRAEYIPEVIKAFPEYAKPEKTDRTGLYELTAAGITKLAGEERPEPERLTAIVPLDAPDWEMINSPAASVSLDSDPSDGALIQAFQLPEVGDYTNISRSIPGATAARPTASLTELTAIEIQLLWKGEAPVSLETKLVDDHGKTVGITKFIEPDEKSRTIRIPAGSLKGYWGARSFDYSRVRRLELAVARKVRDHAAEGTVRIQRIALLGTGERLESPAAPPRRTVLATLSLRPKAWPTAHSKQAKIKLAAEGPLLVCRVDLPYDKQRDETLPWTNLETELDRHDFPSLQALELELRWDGAAPVTIEPKLVTSVHGDTYGKQIRIKPGAEFQKILVRPQELKYYWSQTGPRDATRMNLRELNRVSLGIARKAVAQAPKGTLFIKAIRLLGPEKGSTGN